MINKPNILIVVDVKDLLCHIVHVGVCFTFCSLLCLLAYIFLKQGKIQLQVIKYASTFLCDK